MTSEIKKELDALCLKFRRSLIETLHDIQTGHPGGSLSVCEILTTLYFDEANITPENAGERSRDKIILCKFVFLAVINIYCEILACFLREVFQGKTFIPAEIARLP